MGFVNCIQTCCNQSETQPVLKKATTQLQSSSEPQKQQGGRTQKGKTHRRALGECTARGHTSSSRPPPRASPSPCAAALPPRSHPAQKQLGLTWWLSKKKRRNYKKHNNSLTGLPGEFAGTGDEFLQIFRCDSRGQKETHRPSGAAREGTGPSASPFSFLLYLLI